MSVLISLLDVFQSCIQMGPFFGLTWPKVCISLVRFLSKRVFYNLGLRYLDLSLIDISIDFGINFHTPSIITLQFYA